MLKCKMMKPDVFAVIQNIWKNIRAAGDWIACRRWARTVINLGMILAVLIFVLNYVSKDWNTLSHLKISISIDKIFWSFLFFGINYLVLAQIWHLLVNLVGGNVDWKDNYQLYSYSYLSRFLPTPVWYLASRAALYEKYGISKRNVLLLTIFETLLHLISGFAFYCLLFIKPDSPITFLFILGLLPVAIVILFPKKIFAFIANQKDGEPAAAVSSKRIIYVLILYAITWIVSGLFFKSTIQITSSAIIGNRQILIIWIISTIISYISTYTLGGVGMFREFSLTFLLSPHFTPPIALMITILVRLVMTVAGVIWSFFVMGLIKLSSKHKVAKLRNT